MQGGTKFAVALLLLMLAGLAMFIAFHPNGISTSPGGPPVSNISDVVTAMQSATAKGGTQ